MSPFWSLCTPLDVTQTGLSSDIESHQNDRYNPLVNFPSIRENS